MYHDGILLYAVSVIYVGTDLIGVQLIFVNKSNSNI